MRAIRLICLFLVVMLVFSGCGAQIADVPETAEVKVFMQITQEEAKKMMEADDGHVVVDVRRPDEFAEGHIPGAVNVPNESIISERPAELPDTDQTILIYCRTGRRSKEASQKLAEMGYSKVYEFGGIVDWTGEVVKDEEEEMIAENNDPEMNALKLFIGGLEVPVDWEDNESVEALRGLVDDRGGSLTVEMKMYGGFEQVGPLGQRIESSDVQTTTGTGDIVLYSGNQIVLFYGQNSWAYTRLGRISLPDDEIITLLSAGPVSIALEN